MDLDTLNGLKQCPLFFGIGDNELIEMMHAVRYRVVRVVKGDCCIQAGTVCLHADIILSGDVIAWFTGPTGRVIRWSMHHSGNLLAPAFLFSAEHNYPVTVEAVSNVLLFRLSSADLETLIRIDSRIAMNFVRMLSNNIVFLTKKVGELSMSIREKVESYLRELIRQQKSQRILLPMSRQELANHFGIQKYSLQRCLTDMQNEGLLKLDGKIIEVLK